MVQDGAWSRPGRFTGRLPTKTKGLAVTGQALVLIGGAKRDRTADLYNAIVALSQLSYGPETPACGSTWAGRHDRSGANL